MKLSTLLELLLILIIIAFAASKPYSGSSLRKNSLKQAGGATTENSYEDEDNDDGDFFGLGGADEYDDDDKVENVSQNDNLDETDGEFLLFGEDLFGIFDDEENEVSKKKPKLPTTTQQPINIKLQPIKTVNKNELQNSVTTSVIPIETVQAVVNQLTPNNDNSLITKPQLNLQHTSALLELAQNTHTPNEDSTDSLDQENLILTKIKNSENIDEPVTNENVLETLSSEDDKNNLISQSSIPKSTTPAPTKSTTKPPEGFLGIVSSLISDDEEEDTDVEDDEDLEDDDDDDDKEDDDSAEEINQKKKTTTTIKPNKKRKKQASLIDTIGETLGL